MSKSESLNIAMVCGPVNGSPKVLAETMHAFIGTTEHRSRVFFQEKAIKRLLPAKAVGINPIVWLFYRIRHFINDSVFFARLKKMDAVIICDWTPRGFYKETYNIEKLRRKLRIPIFYYAVQFLGNSPTISELLKKGNHAGIERYDWHLTISEITEMRGIPAEPWSAVGLYLKGTGLKPEKKKELLAVVDFQRDGFEAYRKEQIDALEELGIPYISLEGEYSLQEIREIYKQGSVFFIQCPEAYGLPIAECFATGSYVAIPDSSWAMSWRLDKHVEIHGPGRLADCFLIYNGKEGLKNQLEEIKSTFDPELTPKKVFESFLKDYRSFYEGNPTGLMEVFEKIKNS